MPKIVPHPDLVGYGASPDGRVWTRHRRGPGTELSTSWQVLQPYTTNNGYLRVSLVGRRKRSVHRFVLECFVGPCPDGMEGRHLDGDRTNNAISNLEWSDHKTNLQDRHRHGTYAIASDYGISQPQVSKIKTKRQWAHA